MSEEFVYSECPSCGKGVYDNRADNAKRVAEGKKPAPDFKCKDPSCGWVKWPPKESKKPAPKAEPKSEKHPAVALYDECLHHAYALAKALNERPDPAFVFTGSDVAAIAATLFIQRSRA